MRNPLTPISLAAFLLAIVAWGGVWFLFSDISARLTARAETLSMTGVLSSKQANAVAVHALVSGTAQARAQLDSSVSTDVVGIADQINAASKAAGVQTSIGSASVIASAASSSVSELEFTVQSTGSFQQVWRAAQLFGALPLASRVTELDVEQIPGTGKGIPQWQLTAHIDVLTSAQVSS